MAAALVLGGVSPSVAAPPNGAVQAQQAATSTPLKSATPTISGTAQVGKTLKASTGPWQQGATLRYQWYANGNPIAGATKATLTLSSHRLGRKISVKVTGKLVGFTTTSKTSKVTKPVLRGTLTAKTPGLSGTARVGGQVRAHPGAWTSGTSFSYQWYSNGRAIAGATRSTYTVAQARLGARLHVKVTGRKAGYTTVAKVSRKSSVVQKAGWLTTRYGTFTEKRISGWGDEVIKLPAGAKAGIVVATHSGSSNFIIETTDTNGAMGDLLVNEIGDYRGTTAFGLHNWGDGDARYVEVTADGEWHIAILPMSSVPRLPTTGRGDGVFHFTSTAPATRTLRHTGQSNFIVETYVRDEWDLVVNEIGAYSGRKRMSGGPGILVVTADGSWRIQ